MIRKSRHVGLRKDGGRLAMSGRCPDEQERLIPKEIMIDPSFPLASATAWSAPYGTWPRVAPKRPSVNPYAYNDGQRDLAQCLPDFRVRLRNTGRAG